MLLFSVAGRYSAYKEGGCVVKQHNVGKIIQKGTLSRLLLSQHVMWRFRVKFLSKCIIEEHLQTITIY